MHTVGASGCLDQGLTPSPYAGITHPSDGAWFFSSPIVQKPKGQTFPW